MILAIGDSLSNLASCNDGEDGEDKDDEETQQGKLSEDDEPSWLMGTFTKTVQQRLERFQQKQMKLDELTQPRWEDATDYLRERFMMYRISELRVPAIIQPQTDDDAAAPAPITFGELMESLEIVHGILQIPQGTSGLESNQIRLGLVKPQSNMSISGLELATEHETSPLLKLKSVEPVSFDPCILHPGNYPIDFGLG